MKYLYRLYQLVVCVPVVIIWSIIISQFIIIGCALYAKALCLVELYFSGGSSIDHSSINTPEHSKLLPS